jgi:hypothetical protein
VILFLCEIEIEVREIEEEFQGVGDKKKREMENQREIWESKERIERFECFFFFRFYNISRIFFSFVRILVIQYLYPYV